MFTSKLASVAGFVGAAMLVAAIAPATSAFAAAPDDQITISVSVADLNMTSEAGVHAALARIRHAASDICGDDGASHSLTEQMELRTCVDTTIDRAVAASNVPALIALNQGRHVTALASAAR